jgi:type I restriction enzyme M protein
MKDVERIVATYRAREFVDKYAYAAPFAEIQENNFNLNIPRYVDAFEEEAEIDVAAVQAEIDGLEAELIEAQRKMKRFLIDLRLSED